MAVLIVLLFALLLINAYVQGSKEQALAQKAKLNFVVEEVVKNCPPHKWRHLEVRDTEGNTVKWRLVCDICGPLKPQTGPARAE